MDGAFMKETGKAAVGVIIRNAIGIPLMTAWRLLTHCLDAEEAEALACLEGIRMAGRWPETEMILEADCSTVIKKFKAEEPDRSLVAPIVRDGLHEVSQLGGVVFVKIGREQNKVAHELAHLAIRTNDCQASFVEVPSCVRALVDAEKP
jgi:ribonuclease HI